MHARARFLRSDLERLCVGSRVDGVERRILGFIDRLESVPLPATTQLLVLTAAAEPLGDPLLLHRAGEILGFELADSVAAVDAGLLDISQTISFVHPLVRSADQEAEATVDAAWGHGTRYFDTAPMYGAGLAEIRLGKYLAQHDRDDYVLSTKVGRLILDEATGACLDRRCW